MSFDDLMGSLPSPMFIVTARRGAERSGCLVGFATQVSISPSRFIACVSRENHTYSLAQDAHHVAVHVVPQDAAALAELFGGETGDDTDKFADVDWRDGPHGLPILEACDSWFAGRIIEHLDLGDHMGLVLDPEQVSFSGPGRVMTADRANAIEPGHEP